jgi:FkbM family methyltransferase
MKKLLFISPHLSTGGAPQYLLKKIQELLDSYEIYCVEYSNITGGVLIIQRSQIENILCNKLITLDENKAELINYIKIINPDIIHFEEMPEFFCDDKISDKIYTSDRKYVIIETSHDSSFDVNNKRYFPDKFIFVSEYQKQLFSKLNIPSDVVEYPIEYKLRNITKEDILQKLGLDPNFKHIINVGLFTSRKNQKEIVEYAKKLKNYPIQFHFIGNQADNFRDYWEPIMKDFPSNCKWWGERSDVDVFYQMADLFLFTSRGNEHDKETMPLVIREAIGWNLPILIYNLSVYLNYFDKHNNVKYLDFDNVDNNCDKILNELHLEKNNINDCFDILFIEKENKIVFNYKKTESIQTKIVIKDKESNAPIYWFDAFFKDYSGCWCIPTPIHSFDFFNEPSFSTLLIEFYNVENNLLYSKDIFIKKSTKKRTFYLDIINPFDCLFNNYNEMFVENKYDCYSLKNLDVVLDIGANNGLFSLLMLNNGCKKIYAFEPNEKSLINLKHFASNSNNAIEVIEKAIYTKNENLEFFIDNNNTTIGSLSKTHLQLNGSDIQKIIVPAISIKTFIDQHNIEKISLIKMDIEGAEYDIIDNLENDVYEKTDSFLIEYHDNNDQRVIKIIETLKNKGYDIQQIRDQNSRNNALILDTYDKSVTGTIFAKKSLKEKILTIIIPCYNHEKYIEKCIDSVLNQKTLFSFNILISDDCSSDNTFDIIQKYKNISNIEIHKTDKNEGPTPIRVINLLKNVKSKYVTFLDGDDYYTDEYKLQKQVNFLEQNTGYVIHSTGYYITKEDSIFYGTNPPMELYMYSTKEEVVLQNNLEVNYISFGFMFNNLLIQNYKFPDWIFDNYISDGYWALINILLQYGKAKNEKWVSGRYRITPNGDFGQKSEEYKQIKISKQSNIFKKVFQNNINPIIIVDAFFHDKHCVKVFKEYLDFIKKTNIPIMLVTNSEFDPSLIKEVDYIFYDSNNRLFEKQYNYIDYIVFYYATPYYYISLGTDGFQKHGLSVLSNLYHTSNLAKSLGYTHFYRIEYDCKIENVNKIKDMIYELNDKKGIVYIHQNKYVSHQIWYFELDYFVKNFPNINNEEDYIKYKANFNYYKDFVSSEEFIYNMIKFSNNGFNNIIVKDAPFMHTDFGNCEWNTIMTPVESKKIVNGFVASMHKITTFVGKDIKPENSPVNNNQAAFITWNCSSSNLNKSKAKITYPSGKVQIIDHVVNGINDNKVDIIELENEDINVEISINEHSTKHFKINKDSVFYLTDVYQKYN